MCGNIALAIMVIYRNQLYQFHHFNGRNTQYCTAEIIAQLLKWLVNIFMALITWFSPQFNSIQWNQIKRLKFTIAPLHVQMGRKCVRPNGDICQMVELWLDKSRLNSGGDVGIVKVLGYVWQGFWGNTSRANCVKVFIADKIIKRSEFSIQYSVRFINWKFHLRVELISYEVFEVVVIRIRKHRNSPDLIFIYTFNLVLLQIILQYIYQHTKM